MSKEYKIRWRESDTAELQKAINNFNAKLYRIKKKNPEMAEYLPERVKKSDAVKNIATRADLNKTLKSLKRFTEKGAETPVKSTRSAKTTQWELDEFKRKQRAENARRAKERKKLEQKPATSRGKKTDLSVAEMGSLRLNELKPNKTKFKNLSQKEWDKAKRGIDKAITPMRQEFDKHNMRLNYIKGLRNAGFSEDIVALVLEVDIDTFIETTMIDTEGDFDFIYDEIEFKLHQDALYEVWENALNKGK